ncbi:hypothetical protein [Neisseria iguanae]|uniref:ISXO2-like transposase domain-containing protein n=1 Tax=Neisseria iguanae TaxID=90242 RepID=A0A2P7U391_9NEIS|nr:hypothetical protein [Neisseria iguanae]PSJ81383.1 hypothetical protein C7N83_00965 [Neisseria iguanae]
MSEVPTTRSPNCGTVFADECGKQTPFSDITEPDGPYSGARRIRGKRARGAGGKTTVLGILERDDKVRTGTVPGASKVMLQKVIRGHLPIKGVTNTGGRRGSG